MLAAAGSGKTSVIIRRIQHILSRGVPPSSVLAITFTKAAAEEMRERLLRSLGRSAEAVVVSTFHALSLQICREHADRVGYGKDFVVRTAKQQRKLVEEALREHRTRQVAAAAGAAGSSRTLDADRVLQQILRAKAQGLGPEASADPAVRAAHEQYVERMRADNAMDMLDFLDVAVTVLRQHEEVRAQLEQRHAYVLVDEFQDSNELQLQLLRLLAPPAPPAGETSTYARP